MSIDNQHEAQTVAPAPVDHKKHSVSFSSPQVDTCRSEDVSEGLAVSAAPGVTLGEKEVEDGDTAHQVHPVDILLSDIKLDPLLDVRKKGGSCSARKEGIQAYSSIESSRFPPVVLDQNHVLISGHARYESAKMRKDTAIKAIIQNFKDDQERKLHAIEANSTHGVRMRGGDIDEFALALHSAGWSCEKIGKLYGVSKATVSRRLKALEGKSPRCKKTNVINLTKKISKHLEDIKTKITDDNLHEELCGLIVSFDRLQERLKKDSATAIDNGKKIVAA